jgi:hypothetical protein
MQEQFEELERSACRYKSVVERYDNMFSLNHALQPKQRCLHGGVEPIIDEKISFRGDPLQRCDFPKQMEGSYADAFYHNVNVNVDVSKKRSTGRFNEATSARMNSQITLPLCPLPKE